LIPQALRGNSYAGDPEQLLARYLDIFGDRFYLEVSTYGEIWQHDLNKQLEALAKENSIPMVYANDAHYAYPGQYQLHETVLCMRYQEKVSVRTEPHHIPDLYIMGEDEVNKALNHLDWDSEPVETSDLIADRCNVTFPGRKVHVPVFIPESKWANSRAMLFDLASDGYRTKIIEKGLDSDEYMERFKEELKVIFEADLVDYFLIVRDFIAYANSSGHLVGPGRGSVGGSLIAFLVGITQIDPIKYGLIFERFYNAGREGSLPDIDTDFPTFGREFIRDYLIRTYGEEYVADIGTVTSYQGRNAIQKLGSAMEIPFNDIKKISQVIEGAIESGLQPNWEALNKIPELTGWRVKYPDLFEYAEQLYGNTFTYGIHASGILISDEPLAASFPLRWHAKEKKPVTQFDYRTADKQGFMKVDVLGLRNLDILMELNSILKKQGIEPIDFQSLQDEDHPAEMYELLEKGLTVGLFQVEEKAGVKELCRKIKPRNVEELALITALNRPGPLIAGSDRRYLKGRNGEEVNYIHPLLEKVAGDTYGEFIYQEQVIQLFRELGYSLQEADNVRAILGKKLREEMAKIKPDFLTRFVNHPDTQKLIHPSSTEGMTLGLEVWDMIENFSKYAFNKAHSTAYGIILLWTMYAKWKYPREFYLASMRTVVKEGKKEKLASYVKEAPRMDVAILRPELNVSKAEASIEEQGIRYGYADVKGVGIAAARWIEANQPFKDFDDLLEVSQRDDKKITLKNGLRKVAIHKGQIESLRQLTELKDRDLIEVEENLLGIALSDNSDEILNQYSDMIEAQCVDFETVLERHTVAPNQKLFKVAGVIVGVRETKTKKGTAMAWLTIQNQGLTLDMTVWQEELHRLRFALKTRTAGIFTIAANERGINLREVKILFRQD